MFKVRFELTPRELDCDLIAATRLSRQCGRAVYGAGFRQQALRRQGFEYLHYQSLFAYRINYLVLEIFNRPLKYLDQNENPYQMNRIIQRSVKTNLVKLIVDQNIPTSIINQSSDRSGIPNLKFLDPKSDVLKSGTLFYYA